MYCKYCGKQIDNDSIFCSFCGKKQSEELRPDPKKTNEQKTSTADENIERSKDTTIKEKTSQSEGSGTITIETDSPSAPKEQEITYTETESDNGNEHLPTSDTNGIADDGMYVVKDYTPAAVGVLVILVNFIALANQEDIAYALNLETIYAIGLLFRLFATIWIVRIAQNKNRNAAGWGIFAFALPAAALIAINFVKRKRKAK